MTRLRRALVMLILGASGGAIFLLPFLREVFYQPLADALALDNTESGMLMSVFGVTSMLAYLPGGWLADRWSPRWLMSAGLVITGGLGLWLATYPSYAVCLAIHGAWGVSIVLLFWASMMRMTRGWAGEDEQGRAFGWLESTRGVSEIALNSSALALFWVLGSSAGSLAGAITLLSTVVVLLGIACAVCLDDAAAGRAGVDAIGLKEFLVVWRMPTVWLIAVVVLTAYSAYWASFYFTPYAGDVFALSVGAAGAISVGRQWLKPLSAALAGMAADRFGVARTTTALFIVLTVSFGIFVVMPTGGGMLGFVLVNIALAAIAIFGLRGIYFALMEVGGVPQALTGTAVGVISVVGYTPDITMPLIGGWLLDRYPDGLGYRYYYALTAVLTAIGAFAAWRLGAWARKPQALAENTR
ncbi:MAG: MFS transporter [Pseudomonadota bacterium]